MNWKVRLTFLSREPNNSRENQDPLITRCPPSGTPHANTMRRHLVWCVSCVWRAAGVRDPLVFFGCLTYKSFELERRHPT